jgi:hypothetical protein
VRSCFQVEPKRWIVERTWTWARKCSHPDSWLWTVAWKSRRNDLCGDDSINASTINKESSNVATKNYLTDVYKHFLISTQLKIVGLNSKNFSVLERLELILNSMTLLQKHSPLSRLKTLLDGLPTAVTIFQPTENCYDANFLVNLVR